jgi:hypothetical protein
MTVLCALVSALHSWQLQHQLQRCKQCNYFRALHSTEALHTYSTAASFLCCACADKCSRSSAQQRAGTSSVGPLMATSYTTALSLVLAASAVLIQCILSNHLSFALLSSSLDVSAGVHSSNSTSTHRSRTRLKQQHKRNTHARRDHDQRDGFPTVASRTFTGELQALVKVSCFYLTRSDCTLSLV